MQRVHDRTTGVLLLQETLRQAQGPDLGTRMVHRVGKGAPAWRERHCPGAQQAHMAQGLPMARIKVLDPTESDRG